jgi:hypothetical protein
MLSRKLAGQNASSLLGVGAEGYLRGSNEEQQVRTEKHWSSFIMMVP